IEASIEVNVPVSVAYNQWTQFEDFPLFMEGVDHVQQIDDTRLHWVASVAGKKAEWDAKILEQHPDRQISWISEDGKKTRGTVSFEPRSEGKTLVRLSMSYQADPLEAVGSVAGLDSRRVKGDLDRFKELIESRGTESGPWRGSIRLALDVGIQLARSAPERRDRRGAADHVPDARGNNSAWTCDASHLRNAAHRLGHEMDDELRQRRVELVVSERQALGGG